MIRWQEVQSAEERWTARGVVGLYGKAGREQHMGDTYLKRLDRVIGWVSCAIGGRQMAYMTAT